MLLRSHLKEVSRRCKRKREPYSQLRGREDEADDDFFEVLLGHRLPLELLHDQ